MFTQLYKGVRLFLGLDKPVKVSKEVIDFLDEPHNPGFMGQGPKEKDVGHSECRRAAQLGMYTDPNASCGEVTQNPWQGNRPLQDAAVVEKVVDSVRDAFYGRTKPTAIGPEPGHDLRGNRIMSSHIPDPSEVTWRTPMDPAPLEAYLRGWVPGSDMDRVFEELEGLVKSQLTPRLVIDNVSQPVMIADLRPSKNEPCLLDTVNRRRLNKEWLDWCVETYGVNHSHAFEVGAKSMIDNEFAHGKMRKNVEILPWDPSDPLLVKIKYHDPMDPTDPWFEESK